MSPIQKWNTIELKMVFALCSTPIWLNSDQNLCPSFEKHLNVLPPAYTSMYYP